MRKIKLFLLMLVLSTICFVFYKEWEYNKQVKENTAIKIELPSDSEGI